eukprot:scaffold9344_cov150-Skeletonema_dohrnii-CCMP3373.AAC.7
MSPLMIHPPLQSSMQFVVSRSLLDCMQQAVLRFWKTQALDSFYDGLQVTQRHSFAFSFANHNPTQQSNGTMKPFGNHRERILISIELEVADRKNE